MKKIILLVLVGILASCSLPQRRGAVKSSKSIYEKDVPTQARATYDEAPRQRIAVLPFLDDSGQVGQKALEGARKRLIRKILRNNQFIVIQNDDFPEDVSRYVQGGQYNLLGLSKLAAGMGVPILLEGKILEMQVRKTGDEVGLFRKFMARIDTRVRLRAVSTKNGKEILNMVRTASMEGDTTRFIEKRVSTRSLGTDPRLVNGVLDKALSGVVGRIGRSVGKLSWEGRIALMNGDRIYINAGRLSGLQMGDILRVSEEGEEIYDPDTGLLIGKSPGRTKGTVEIISYFGKDGAVAIVHSGAGFRENDRVEMY